MIDALFLDRDGIINEVVMRGNVVSSPRNLDELKIRDEFSHFYQKIVFLKFPLLVVSNQPDVRRDLMSHQDLDSITEFIAKKFPKLQFTYCVHDDRDQCACRKPKPGMIADLLKKYSLEAQKSWIIGDSDRDIEAGHRAGVTTILLRTPYNRIQCFPHFAINGLSEFFSILSHRNKSPKNFQSS